MNKKLPHRRRWLLCGCLLATPWVCPSQTLSRNPDNPRCLVYRGKPVVLITSTEHYGAVLNRDFQYVPYLVELARNHLNLTRTFTFHREFEKTIPTLGFSNTLAPRPNREIVPWKRTGPGRALDGGLQYDLKQWNPEYFARFKDFLGEAARRGILVQVSLFCRPYDALSWSGFPCNPKNNVNGVGGGIKDLTEYFEGRDTTVVDFQTQLANKMVTELNGFDNMYFEVLNEGYGASTEKLARLRAWQLTICDVIRATEKGLPKKHLIAVNAHQRAEGYVHLRIGDDSYVDEPRVDIFNYHYMSRRDPGLDMPPLPRPEGKVGRIWAFLKSRRYLKRPLIFDENWSGILNGAPPNWTRNRMEAWETILGGGAGFDYLDWSFMPGDPTGTGKSTIADGRHLNGERLREQFGQLAALWREAGPDRMAPDDDLVISSPPNAMAFASSRNDRKFHVVYVADARGNDVGFGEDLSGEVQLRLGPGEYRLRVLNAGEKTESKIAAGRSVTNIALPKFRQDCALVLLRQ